LKVEGFVGALLAYSAEVALATKAGAAPWLRDERCNKFKQEIAGRT